MNEELPDKPSDLCKLGEECYKKQDYTQAIYWFHKSAEQEYAEAQLWLSIMYEEGSGGNRDFSKAFSWCQKAATQGNADAQYNLGVMYRNGQGTTRDDRKAVYWYGKAAEQGVVLAQNNLGYMYQHGYGVCKNYEQAYFWYYKAAKQGYNLARNNLDYLRKLQIDEGSRCPYCNSTYTCRIPSEGLMDSCFCGTCEKLWWVPNDNQKKWSNRLELAKMATNIIHGIPVVMGAVAWLFNNSDSKSDSSQ